MLRMMCLFWLILLLPCRALAVECTAVFPDPAASWSSSGYIQFQPGSRLVGSDGLIDFASKVDNAGGYSCTSSACQLSGETSAALLLPEFESASSSQRTVVKQNKQETFAPGDYAEIRGENKSRIILSGSQVTYHIDLLHVGSSGSLELAGGVYWINRLYAESNAVISIASGSQVTLFVGSVEGSGNVQWNAAGDAADLTVYSYGEAKFGQYTYARAFLYAQGTAEFGVQSQQYGAVSASRVILLDSAQIHYQPDSLSTLPAQALCSVAAAEIQPIGYWPIDVCSLSADSSELPDLAGNNPGQALNNPSADNNGRYCQAAYLRGQGEILAIPHQSAYQLVQGSVSLWFNLQDLTHSYQPSAGGMALLSKDSAGLDDGGHLTIWLTSSGSLQVQHQSSTGSARISTSPLVSQGDWHHLIYTFGPQGMQLYLDAQLVGSNSGFTFGLTGNQEPWVLGANAGQSGDGVSPPEQLTDFYRGSLDEFKIFNAQLSQDQVSQLFVLPAHSCITCTSQPEMTAHWQMDVCSLSGVGNEIVDSVNGLNGQVFGNASAVRNGRFCQSAGFDGTGDYVAVPYQSKIKLSQGTLVFWLKASDLNHGWRYLDGLQGLFARNPQGGSANNALNISLDAQGRLVFEQAVKGSQKQVTLYTDAVISEHNWHQVAYSWGDGRLVVHVDGVYLGELAADTSNANNTDELIMAARVDDQRGTGKTLGHYFKGELDDVRLYQDILTTADVQTLYYAADYVCPQCGNSGPLLTYRFEQDEWLDDGDVLDSSGNTHHGTAVGNAQPVFPDLPVSCRVLSVPGNDSISQRDGVDTRLDVNDIGERGTISFWYRSNLPWQGGGSRQLLDGSLASRRFDFLGLLSKYFFLSLNNNGELTFGLEDALDFDLLAKTQALGFADNEWVHLAISWDVPGEELALHVNGQQVALYGSANLVSSMLGNLSTLVIGDNASSYLPSGSSASSANGEFDDLRVYDYRQSAGQIQQDMQDVLSCSAVHHYQITHPTQALTCSAAQVQLTACANASCSEWVTTPVSVNLATGQNGQYGSGRNATFTGTTEVSLSQTSAGVFDILLSADDAASSPVNSAQCSADCQIEFAEAGFEFFDAVSGSTALADIIAEESLSSVGLRAVKDNGEGMCQALLAGEQTIELGFDCISPAEADYSPNQCRVPLSGVPIQGDGSGMSQGEVTLSFDANGETRLDNFRYADAGRLRLSARAQIQQVGIATGSATFDSIPAELRLEADVQDPHIAGEAFTLTLSAHGANGSVLPGYQPGELQASAQRIIPASTEGKDGGWVLSASARLQSSLSEDYFAVDPGPFELGQFQTQGAYLEEVGTYVARLRDNNYLGNRIESAARTMGRFIPAYFDIESELTPAFAATCSDTFTYTGQEFGFESGREPGFIITAYNAKGQVTQNYAGNLWQLSPDLATAQDSLTVTHSSDYAGELQVTQGASQVEISAQQDYDGSAILRLFGTELAYRKLPVVSAQPGQGSPFNTVASLTWQAQLFSDADGVCYQHNYPGNCAGYTVADIQGPPQRYGRLRLENTYGPENEPLRMPLVAEYFSQGSWLRNSLDSCTDLSLSSDRAGIVLKNGSSGVGEADLASQAQVVEIQGRLNQGLSGLDDLVFLPIWSNQGEALRGSIDVSLDPAAASAAWADYLNIDWDLNGVIDENDQPQATVSFGLFRGNDRLLFKREKLNY